ncbi:hypothetical protein C0993_008394 [Termitomyces sp. T159_Od127]|nr:hypothetical protein C0993_008394 [Termitomyces sp. T159_Od127]
MQGYFCAAFGANLVQMVFASLGLNPVMNIMCLPFALVVSVIASTTVFRNVFVTYDSFSSEGTGPNSSNSTPLNYSGRLAMSGTRVNTSRRVTTEIPLNDYKSTGAVGAISVHRVVELAHDDDAPHTCAQFHGRALDEQKHTDQTKPTSRYPIINGFLKDLHGSGDAGGKGSLALRSLVMITKAFLSQRSMNEVFSGGLGSYSIVCLAVSFLQMHPKIRRGEIDADCNLGVLVMEFFELYGCYFNYNEVGISVREGGMYFSKRRRGWFDHQKQGLLSIEDPADPSNDISRGSFAFKKVRQTFAGAHSILTSSAYLTAGILSSRRQGRAFSLRDESEELSILSSIMGVTQETINHRKLVQEVYDKRVLHNLLNLQAKPVVVNGSVPERNGVAKLLSMSTGEAAYSVKSAWAEADNEDAYSHKRRHDAVDEEEEGRYRIGRQQPPKRQRTGGRKDAHITFTTDEETLSEDEKEDLHYGSDIEIIEGPSTRPPSSRDSGNAAANVSENTPFVVGRDANLANRNSKGQPQPGNLKERIAALEQRNALSSSDRPSSPSIPLAPGAVSNSAGLRDKIAKFERKGGVPVPRGSFGLGAPPRAENAPLKRRGELYGNRIPGVRAVSGMTGGRVGSPFDAGRVVSMPNMDGVCNGKTDDEYLPPSPSSPSSPSPQFTGLTPQHTGTIGTITQQTTGSALTPQSTGNREPLRVTSNEAALDLTRQAEAESQTETTVHSAAVPPAASPGLMTYDREGNSSSTASAPASPSIIPENQEDVDAALAQPQVSSSPESSDELVPAAEPATPPQPSTPSIVLSPSNEQERPLVLSVSEETTKTGVAEEKVEPTAPALPITPPLVVLPAPDATEPASKTLVEPESEKSPSVSLSPAESTLSQPTTNTKQSPPSPLGPFSLANAVNDLGKVVANIQDMFPGQISPLSAPPICRPLVINIPSTSKETNTPTDTKKTIPDLEPKLEASSEAASSETRPIRVPATSSVTKPTELLTSPRSGNARPVSMFATSPNHVESHVTPTASRGTFLSGPQVSGAPAKNYEPQSAPQKQLGTKGRRVSGHIPLAITPIPKKEAACLVDAAPEAEIKSPTQTSPRSLRYFTSLKRFASSSKTSLTSNPRDSVSASSEVSSEDWSVIPTPVGNGAETESKGGLFNGPGIGWPVLSPKKSQGVGRSASFTDKIFNRNWKTSKTSSVGDTSSAYESIDRLVKSKAGNSAASLLPPLEPVSFTLNVPIIHENDQVLPSPPELVSPKRSASLYVPSTSQFPPVLSARPTSSFYTSIPQMSEISTSPRTLDSVDEDKLASPNFISPTGTPQQSIDAIFSATPMSPVYTPHLSSAPDVPTQTPSNTTNKQQHNRDAALFSVQPTSPVYTPHAPAFAMRSEETITDSPLLPSPRMDAGSPSSWISNVSVDSFASSIPSPFFDSFPSVPQELPLAPALPGRQRNFTKPSLPLSTASSFFESAPGLSSAAVGAEFLGGSSPFVKNSALKSATLPQTSGEHCRS